MVWQVVACVLATAGLILFAWCLIGSFLLPVAGRNLTVVYRARGDAPDLEQAVRSLAWLRGTGMVDVPLQIVDCGMEQAARQRAERLARAHPFIQVVPAPAAQGEEACGRSGDPPRQRGDGDLSER